MSASTSYDRPQLPYEIALNRNDLDQVRRMLANNVPVSTHDLVEALDFYYFRRNKTNLSEEEWMHILQTMIQRAPVVKKIDDDEMDTPLATALSSDDREMAERLVDAGHSAAAELDRVEYYRAFEDYGETLAWLASQVLENEKPEDED